MPDQSRSEPREFGDQLRAALRDARTDQVASTNGAAVPAVWLVYAREDADEAEVLIEGLGARGISVMWDRLLPPGRHYDEEIERGIRTSIAVLGLFSEASIKSSFMRDEATLALEFEKLIPVLVGDFDAQALPMRFRRLQASFAHRIDDLERAIRARQQLRRDGPRDVM